MESNRSTPIDATPKHLLAHEDPAEAAYWEMDARIKGYGEWKGRPQSERDAFKAVACQLMHEKPLSKKVARENLYSAAIDCGHEIEADRIVLHRDPNKPGNALGQLGDRLAEAAKSIEPSVSNLPLSIPDVHDAIRQAGGIVHSDGNIFLPKAEKFIVAAVLCGELRAPTIEPSEGGNVMPKLPAGWSSLGVGDGSGNLFVHGPYDAIKRCQKLVIAGPADQREQSLAMMIRMLCSNTANDGTRKRAGELLRKYGLQGSPLRAASGQDNGAMPKGEVPRGLRCDLPPDEEAVDWMRMSWFRDDGSREVCSAFIRVDLLNERWAEANHGQSLQRLRERGGLGPSEALAIVLQRSHARVMSQENAYRALVAHVQRLEGSQA